MHFEVVTEGKENASCKPRPRSPPHLCPVGYPDLGRPPRSSISSRDQRKWRRAAGRTEIAATGAPGAFSSSLAAAAGSRWGELPPHCLREGPGAWHPAGAGAAAAGVGGVGPGSGRCRRGPRSSPGGAGGQSRTSGR